MTHAARAVQFIAANEPQRTRALLRAVLQRVEVHADAIRLELSRRGLRSWLQNDGPVDDTTPTAATRDDAAAPIDLCIDATLQRRGVEARFVLQGRSGGAGRPDANLTMLIARAHRCLALLTSGLGSMDAVGKVVSLPASEVSRILPFAFLAPDIVRAILAGEHPVTLTAERLKRLPLLPLDWAEQRTLLGFTGAP